MTEHLENTWNEIMQDKNHHIIVKEIDDRIVSSCVCVIIPNLTRSIRPYAFIENVVTHSDYRGKGYATECLNYAKNIAEKTNCYKMMLLTGSKKDKTLNFYANAGYNSTDKTACQKKEQNENGGCCGLDGDLRKSERKDRTF
jgi:GNAT superfamily N-acetyltransferase